MYKPEPDDFEFISDRTFLFGTDDMGRNLWTRTRQEARVSLIIAFVAIFIDMLIVLQILPNTMGPIITQVMFSIPVAIFTEAFLSFIGVGIVLPQCSIGYALKENESHNIVFFYDKFLLSQNRRWKEKSRARCPQR